MTIAGVVVVVVVASEFNCSLLEILEVLFHFITIMVSRWYSNLRLMVKNCLDLLKFKPLLKTVSTKICALFWVKIFFVLRNWDTKRIRRVQRDGIVT